MQMNKAILRTKEIVIFNKKKKIFAAARVSFFSNIGNNFFFHFSLRSLILFDVEILLSRSVL